MAEVEGYLLQQVDIQPSCVLNNIVTSWLGGSLDRLMADHKELHLVWMDDGAIDHCSRVHVIKFVVLRWLAAGKESSMVALHNNYAANLRFNAEL